MESPGEGGSARIESIARALGRIPSGLFVVTWRSDEEGADHGMLASWVMQAGFAPPAVSIAVGTSRGFLAAIDAGRPFVVNLLSESQRGLVGRFGRPASAEHDPFAGVPLERAACGAAIVMPTSGWMECRAVSRAPVGDHVIVVAEIGAAGDPTGASADDPIIHLRKNGLRY
jgi:flavin reductase (DIM6/NTAB) family NADH-FMN oxidoreductase RutF